MYSTGGMVQTKIEDRCDVKREPTNSFSSWEHDKEKRILGAVPDYYECNAVEEIDILLNDPI